MKSMNYKITQPASITLCVNGQTFSAENIDWDASADELIEQFKRLTVAAGYPPTILNDEEGYWKYHDGVIE